MGLDTKELRLLDNLDSCGFVPKSISDFLTEVSMIHDIPMKLSKLNDYGNLLEQEMKKIDGLKRELPLCMLLLNDAICKLKEEVVQLKRREVEAVVLEEFMPSKGNFDHRDGRAKRSAAWSDKKNWMSSAQLWTTPIKYENSFNTVKIQDSIFLSQSRPQERVFDGVAKWNPCDQTWSLKKPNGLDIMKTEEEEDYPLDGLSLSMDYKNSKGKNVAFSSDDYGCVLFSEDGSSSQPPSKKHRRCWSNDLHLSFVQALFKLGGPHAATPKQIREIMQADGLTNDQVKSHLQKYRIYLRKLLGSCSDNLPTHPAMQSGGSPDGPLNLGGSAKGASVTGGESMKEVKEEEDVKSESHSWKGRH
ncbi:hypothetical protein ACH5RR_014095 [Cinchona calisaya]|uniref:HTH myb-type domain-containing protein n=1 Tax=Cinchona calisaya TaxID=153742 RepID=A0ABD3A7R1_9GENT